MGENYLLVDTGSPEWRAVRMYVERRIEELKESCVSVGATAEQRLVFAHRIEELRELMDAPERARAISKARSENNFQREVY